MTADAGHQLRVFIDALLENLPQHEANTDAVWNATVQIRHGSIPIAHEVTFSIFHLSLFSDFIVSRVLSVCFLRSWRTSSRLVTSRRTHSTWVSFLASWTQPAFQGSNNSCASDITCAKYTCTLKSFAFFRFGEDELFSNYDSPDILVLRNGHYYTFPVIDAEGFNCFSPLFVSFGSSFRVPLLGVLGKVITPSEIKAHLKYILDDPTPANEFPVCIMTSQDRDTWTVVRRKLVEAGA